MIRLPPVDGQDVHNPVVLDLLLMGQTAGAVSDALRAAPLGPGPVAVIHHVRLGRALAGRGHEIVHVVDRDRPRSRVSGRRVQGRADALPLGAGEVHAVVAFGVGLRPDWAALIAEWCRVVVDGGAVVLVDKAAATELTRRALCGGLTEIEQRRVRRHVITSGRVTRL